ncbi:zinc-ribbon domain-containing protein [Pontibaca methylaminivorans]|uniref:MJ0042 family finger-like domain-containing protein n=1 Tax=Pontibaca methylaminivorans TaxID=515897 RepID=A0A1R3WJA2_9RHOB|nr:zinc-ribbon domain-containing protein [Pontibaca methylaminivorans]SIT78241.1 MJ0042 family finger-like domain-containing protein [Pontibaca methylaminivorans]
MRLICPKCPAQYEVPEDAIPPAGRDVQCSNCGHMWFQRPADDTVESTAPATASTNTPARPRRPLDRAVADILQEEAALETRLRRAEEQGVLETQPDLGLDAAPPMPARAASASGDTTPAAPAPAAPESDVAEPIAAGPAPADPGQSDPVQPDSARPEPRSAEPPVPAHRRNLLPARRPAPGHNLVPDQEEVRLSLGTPIVLYSAPVPQTPEKQPGHSGFLLGLAAAVLLAAGLFLIYGQAGPIARALPQAAPVLDSYTTAVNSTRDWIGALAADLARD